MLLLFGVAGPGGCAASGCHAQRIRWKQGRVVVVARRGREGPRDCSGTAREGESGCCKGATEGEERRRGVLLLVDEGGRWELRVLLLRREEADGLVDGA